MALIRVENFRTQIEHLLKHHTHINMSKLDLSKSDQGYYSAGLQPQLVDVTPYQYIMINGVSSPEDSLFNNAIEALYAVAYGIKFYYKSQDRDFVVPKMEGQWWVTGDLPFEQTPRDQWHWNLVIPMPEFVVEEDFDRCKAAVLIKKQQELITQVQLKPLNEGNSVQILHRGSYDAEGPSIEKLFSFISSEGLEVAGYHHEIYLSDPRRTPEEKLKTIIRYPVAAAR